MNGGFSRRDMLRTGAIGSAVIGAAALSPWRGRG